MSHTHDDVIELLHDYQEARAQARGDNDNEAVYTFLKRIAEMPSAEHDRLTGDCPEPLRQLWDAIMRAALRLYPKAR